MNTMLLIQLLLVVPILLPIVLGQITIAPTYPLAADGWHQAPSLRIQKRQVIDWCGVISTGFLCLQGTCISGTDGYVGCCTASNCVPRTVCIESTTGRAPSCDYSTGGCLYCSDSQRPSCVKKFSAQQYLLSCDSVGFTSTAGETENSTTTMTPVAPLATSTSDAQPSDTTSGTSTSVEPGLSSTQASATSAASKTPAQSDGVGAARKVIIGAVVGSCAFTVLLFVSGILLRSYWAHRKETASAKAQEKYRRGAYTLGSRDDESTNQDKHQPGSGEGGMTEAVNDGNAVELEGVQGRPTEQDQPQYRCINPDSATEQVAGAERPPSCSTSPVPGVAEAPTDSPSMSSMAASPALSNSSLWMRGTSGSTPRRQSQYQAYTPSVYTSGGQPPSSLGRRGVETQPAQSWYLAELDGEKTSSAK